MIRVPAGSFTMGSPEFEDGHQLCEQQREVTFVNHFYLGKSPVTQAIALQLFYSLLVDSAQNFRRHYSYAVHADSLYAG